MCQKCQIHTNFLKGLALFIDCILECLHLEVVKWKKLDLKLNIEGLKLSEPYNL